MELPLLGSWDHRLRRESGIWVPEKGAKEGMRNQKHNVYRHIERLNAKCSFATGEGQQASTEGHLSDQVWNECQRLCDSWSASLLWDVCGGTRRLRKRHKEHSWSRIGPPKAEGLRSCLHQPHSIIQGKLWSFLTCPASKCMQELLQN